MQNASDKFDLWCIVELFGHSKIAGKCTEQNVAGTNMLRVDVPETSKQPAFTRLFGSAAIYAINPVDEVTAKATAERLQMAPIASYDISELLRKNTEMQMLGKKYLESGSGQQELEYNHEDEEEYN